jgi:uncharacterized protein YndB with AHSA1/START domain
MLNAKITIERSPEVVWAYFTEPSNWEKWWGGGLKAAEWREGGQLEWMSGGPSAIKAIVPGRMVQTVAVWADTTWTFEPSDAGRTTVNWEEGSPKRGASFSDGGAAHVASLKSSLLKLKEQIETATPSTPKRAPRGKLAARWLGRRDRGTEHTSQGPITAAQAVDALIAIFDQQDVHSVFDEASRNGIRKIGEALYEAGGMDLMLVTHEMFAARRRPWARSLEQLWDGIGDWRG